MKTAGPNPFVGPRPFKPGEPLYGRDRELTELYFRLSADRIVLLHSPSGAGKSSLVYAGLIPRLRQRFDVWRPTRVNQEPPAGVDVANRYALSALQGFEEGIPEDLRRGAGDLAGLTLADYLAARPRRPGAPESVLVIFDQFEEVLTIDPIAPDAKKAFFDQLGQLLRNPGVWALFVIREDYLAPLDPYARRVPTHLRNRYRIDLLGLDGAREAMVQPALQGRREFPAVDQLLHDLATMKVQLPDGSFEEQTGRYVEPVQLQVVCRRLWNAMPADDLSIDPEDLQRFGDVSKALGAYYDDSVAAAGGDKVADERAVRQWFDDHLITAGGIRGQVLMESNASGGLANGLIESLRDTHLVRAEKRAGATWFELAHDRLIEPVRESNSAWRDEHLSEVQQRASLWEKQDRHSGLLIKDGELAAGERWAAENPGSLKEEERRFLEASREAQDIVEREQRHARRIKKWAIAAMIVSVIALAASVVAGLKWQEAAEKRQEADDQRKKVEELILKANRQGGRIRDLKQILEGPLIGLITPRARAEVLEEPTGRSIRDYKDRQLYAITLWIDLPDVRKMEVEEVEYLFLDSRNGRKHRSFHPNPKTGGERNGGFAITYTGWGCVNTVQLTIRGNGQDLGHGLFDLCEALRSLSEIHDIPQKYIPQK